MVRFAKRQIFADSLDGHGLSTLGWGFVRCFALCSFCISPTSELVHIPSRSVRIEVRRHVSKEL